MSTKTVDLIKFSEIDSIFMHDAIITVHISRKSTFVHMFLKGTLAEAIFGRDSGRNAANEVKRVFGALENLFLTVNTAKLFITATIPIFLPFTRMCLNICQNLANYSFSFTVESRKVCRRNSQNHSIQSAFTYSPYRSQFYLSDAIVCKRARMRCGDEIQLQRKTFPSSLFRWSDSISLFEM